MAKQALAAGICAMLFLAFPAGADRIRVSGGDELAGRLMEIMEGFAVFESRLSGTLLFPLEELAYLKTDESFDVTFNDEDEAAGRFVYEDGEQFLVSGDKRLGLALTDIASAKPSPKVPPEAEKLIADAQAGVMSREGTVDYGAPLLRLGLERQGKAVDFQTKFDLAITDDGRFPRYLRSDTTISKSQFDRFYPTISVGVERDLTEGVAWRTGVYGGAGAAILDSQEQRLDIEAGVGGVVERFDRDSINGNLDFADRMWQAWYYDDSTSSEELEGRVGVGYERDFWKRGRFRQGLVLNPSVSEPGDLRGRSESSLEWSFTDALRLHVNVALDYESDPEWSDLNNWRSTVDAGLSYRF